MLKKLATILFLFSFVFIGCSSVSSGKITEYRITVGTTTMYDFQTLSDKILGQHRFLIDRNEDIGSGSIIETKYEYTEPSNEELIQGIKEVRYQIILEARMKGGVSKMYNIRAIVREYGRFTDNNEWIDIPVNDQIKKRVKFFSNDLKTEFDNKIRAF